MTKNELDFLRESNNIEAEWSDLALQDAILAWEYIKTQQTLSHENIKQTHKLLMRTRSYLNSRWHGVYRIFDVSIGGNLCTYKGIDEKMSKWIVRVNTLVTSNLKGVDAYKGIIKRDHIAYESIHPFGDGNGRTGRIFYNWERLRLGIPIQIIHVGKEQKKYYKWFK